MRQILLLLPICLPWCVLAAADSREIIAAERAALVERNAAEERECASRFALTSCVEQARARHREALSPLRDRELWLDEAERQQRADERLAAIAAKQKAATAVPAAASAPGRTRRAPPAPAASAVRPARASAPVAERAGEAAQRAEAAELRRAQAQAAQARINRRLADRAAQGKPIQTLPAPERASAPGR
jgi:hypothetical protein